MRSLPEMESISNDGLKIQLESSSMRGLFVIPTGHYYTSILECGKYSEFDPQEPLAGSTIYRAASVYELDQRKHPRNDASTGVLAGVNFTSSDALKIPQTALKMKLTFEEFSRHH